MNPALCNIYLSKDTSYTNRFDFYSNRCSTQHIDLTGYVFKAEVRTSADSEEVALEFSIDQINLSEGYIIISLENTSTDELPIGTYYWDLKVTTPDDSIQRWLAGSVFIAGTITR